MSLQYSALEAQLMSRPTLGISALDDPIVSGGKLTMPVEDAS